MSSTMYYTGLTLGRASGRRSDPEWISRLLAEVGTRVIPMWRDHCLVRGDTPLTLPLGQAGEVLAAAGDLVLLGLDGTAAVFAADLSGLDEPAAVKLAGASAAVDVRSLVPAITPAEAGVIAYARGILHWNRNQRFCGTCGAPSEPRDGGHLRACRGCGRLLFPRIEPAVIVLVELPGTPRRCLLGRHQGAAPDRFSTLAGFVEIGECLEDAVRREVAEEAGVALGAVTYRGSQAWPFPAGLMIGFRAEAVCDEVGVDGMELLEARWFTAGELRARISQGRTGGPYRLDSIGKHLIEDWLADQD